MYPPDLSYLIHCLTLLGDINYFVILKPNHKEATFMVSEVMIMVKMEK